MARILWVSSNGPRRAGDDSAPFIQQLARALRARGHDIELLLPHAPGLARSESIEEFRERVRETGVGLEPATQCGVVQIGHEQEREFSALECHSCPFVVYWFSLKWTNTFYA